MEEKIKNEIKEIKEIKMTKSEKEKILREIFSSPTLTQKPIPSPYLFVFQKKYLPYYLTIILLVIILAGSDKLFLPSQKQSSSIAENFQEKVNLPTSPTEENKIARIEPEEIKVFPEKTPTIDSPKDSLNETAGGTTGISSYLNAPAVGSNQNIQYEEIARTAFTKWFWEQAQKYGGVLNFKISEIKFVALKETAQEPEKNWFNSNDSENAFIATVSYSVQATEEAKRNYWIAGNGEDAPNGWVLNKFLFLTIDKNSSGYYLKSAGTGP